MWGVEARAGLAYLGMRERGEKTTAKVIEWRDRETPEGEIGDNVTSVSTVYTDEHTVNHSAFTFIA